MSSSSAVERRYQVFVSSTYLDLRDERQAVISTLLESDAFPAGMELFPAADEDAWDLIRQVIDDSDYYVLIVGGKYGSIDPVEDVSFTEKEFDYALKSGKPVLAFLHGAPEQLTVEQSEKSEDQQERLRNFRVKVERSKHVKYWTSAEQLQGLVAVSFNRIVRQSPAVGWLRADRAASPQALADLAEARSRIAELELELAEAVAAPPSGIDDLSQGDDKVTFPILVRGWIPAASTQESVWVRKDSTWNTILGVIAPNLLVEAEAGALHDTINHWLIGEVHADAVEALRAKARAEGREVPLDAQVRIQNVEIDDEDFGTIMLQLKATGLVEESKRKRSVSDNGIYWTLTSFGERVAVHARAIRRTPEGRTDLSPEEDGAAGEGVDDDALS